MLRHATSASLIHTSLWLVVERFCAWTCSPEKYQSIVLCRQWALLSNRNGGVATVPLLLFSRPLACRALCCILWRLIGHTIKVAESAIVFNKDTTVGQLSALPAMDWQGLIVARNSCHFLPTFSR